MSAEVRLGLLSGPRATLGSAITSCHYPTAIYKTASSHTSQRGENHAQTALLSHLLSRLPVALGLRSRHQAKPSSQSRVPALRRKIRQDRLLQSAHEGPENFRGARSLR